MARVYGIRERDGAYPLGAFYTDNIDSRVWRSAGGIWYQPINAEKVANRRISRERIEQFADGIMLGRGVALNNGSVVIWERIPDAVAQLLPEIQ